VNEITTIFAGRAQLLGDLVTSISILNILKKKYPESHITWPVAKKTRSAIQFIQNHPLIDDIIVSEDDEGNIYKFHEEVFHQAQDKLPFDVQINCNPQARYGWYNIADAHLLKENCLIAGFTEEDYDSLPENEQIPKLYTNDVVIDRAPFITIQTTAGYGQDIKRSPSLTWWGSLVSKINLDIVQIGHPQDVKIAGTIDKTEINFKEQFDWIHNSKVFIGLENGVSWIAGMYGKVPMVNLLTNAQSSHIQNESAWSPRSHMPKIDHFSWDDINGIDTLKVINSVEVLTKGVII